ncbi:hypothetical protein L6452_21697 [Arctium lappa]|uniref:Uncharacterized protein n=1 Tax=Arctium lappa TaxID=4217 RepID=A0ACB9AZE9_ARCLA|nr:hypothetical protein L6452_21697 [Arctium lappa]
MDEPNPSISISSSKSQPHLLVNLTTSSSNTPNTYTASSSSIAKSTTGDQITGASSPPTANQTTATSLLTLAHAADYIDHRYTTTATPVETPKSPPRSKTFETLASPLFLADNRTTRPPATNLRETLLPAATTTTTTLTPPNPCLSSTSRPPNNPSSPRHHTQTEALASFLPQPTTETLDRNHQPLSVLSNFAPQPCAIGTTEHSPSLDSTAMEHIDRSSFPHRPQPRPATLPSVNTTHNFFPRYDSPPSPLFRNPSPPPGFDSLPHQRNPNRIFPFPYIRDDPPASVRNTFGHSIVNPPPSAFHPYQRRPNPSLPTLPLPNLSLNLAGATVAPTVQPNPPKIVTSQKPKPNRSRTKQPSRYTSVIIRDTPPPKRRNLGEILKHTMEQSTGSDTETKYGQKSSQPINVTQIDNKGKAKVGTTHPPTELHLSLFSCPEALRKYPFFRRKVCQPPRGFPMETLRAHPKLHVTIHSLGWDLFCAPPAQYNIDWITDFYTELSCTSGLNLMVRETPVSFSPTHINAVLGLSPPTQSEFHRLMDEASDVDLQTILETIARKGATWSFTGRSRVLKSSTLNPIANVWLSFIRHSLHPSTHDSNLCMERVFLLYCVVAGKHFDVGRVISTLIRRGVERSKARLIFPSVIDSLLKQAGVPSIPTDRLSLENVVLDNANVVRLLHTCTPKTQGPEKERIASLEASFRSFMGEVKTIMKEQRKLIFKQVSERAMSMNEKLEVLLRRSARSEKIEEELTDKLMKFLAFEKSRDDILRAWWVRHHSDVSDVWAPFPLDVLWRTRTSSPTRHE